VDSHDLERIRRSLAMSPSLTPDVASDLIAAIAAVIVERRRLQELVGRLQKLVDELRTLTP
jgi:uncharacterized protein YhaN